MLGTSLALCIAILVIYYSCELFINSIEWVGKKFNVAQSAVGTILAAFGTALPESVVTFVAVAINSSTEQKEIGIGAALGGPLVLGTVAYAVAGICLLLVRRGKKIAIDNEKLRRDQKWFVTIFIFKVFLGLFAFSLKPSLGILFLAAYGWYFHKEMQAECQDECPRLEPLTFQPQKKEPSTFWVLLQTTISLALIFTASQVFVKNLELISSYLNISPLVASLLLSPVATELPEILNAIIWIRQGKENLALGNISGAMMIQATVPSAFGLFFTPWLFDTHVLWAGIVTLLSITYLLYVLKKGDILPQHLIYAGLGYFIFAAVFIVKPA